MWANGGPGVYACDYRKYYLLEDDEWKFDPIPTMMDGKNVLDYFDADIEEKLRQLEEEEAQLEASGAYDLSNSSNKISGDGEEGEEDDEIYEEELLLHKAIKNKQILTREMSHESNSRVPKTISMRHTSPSTIQAHLESVGLQSEGVIKSMRGRKRARTSVPDASTTTSDADGMVVDDDNSIEQRNNDDSGRQKSKLRNKSTSVSTSRAPSSMQEAKRARSKSVLAERVRSQSATRGSKEGSVAPRQLKQLAKSKKSMEIGILSYARGGEADRRHYPKLVKHLNSGKSSLGTSTIGR